jgi:hypothetical protein
LVADIPSRRWANEAVGRLGAALLDALRRSCCRSPAPHLPPARRCVNCFASVEHGAAFLHEDCEGGTPPRPSTRRCLSPLVASAAILMAGLIAALTRLRRLDIGDTP